MNETHTTITQLLAGSPEHRTAAQWRLDAFLEDDGFTLADSYDQLQTIATSTDGSEVVLIAKAGEELAGICMLVRHELEPAHDLTPWLASLYVVPPFRGQGVARRLVEAIESHAREQGFTRLHLYTGEAKGFYRKCGYAAVEEFESSGCSMFLMIKDL